MFGRGYGNGRGILCGLLFGIGGAYVGYSVYKKNQAKVDGFLKSKGIEIPSSSSNSYEGMTMEDLVTSKEKIEDIIAERELGK